MYNQPSQNQPTKWEAKPLFTIHYPLFTNKGMSLMEVLASMFVICIGLLGVLAVIPYGAFQVAKAKNAENTSWMLNGAVSDLQAAGMARIETWSNNGVIVTSIDNTTILNKSLSPYTLDCCRFIMVDPFADMPITTSSHIYRIGTNINGTLGNSSIWQERMTGQDDLVYTTHADKRTDFSGQSDKVLSSGQYTWFFMFRPEVTAGTTNYTTTPWNDVKDTANVDILACFNREGEEKQVLSEIKFTTGALNNNCDYTPFMKGGQITLRSNNAEDLNLKTTKYIFVSWTDNTGANHAVGQWCKVINATEIEPDSSTFLGTSLKRTVFIMPDLNFSAGVAAVTTSQTLQVLIVPGVIYHKQVPNVKIK